MLKASKNFVNYSYWKLSDPTPAPPPPTMDEDFNIYKKYHRNKPIKIENSGLTNYLRIEIEPPTPNITIFLVQLEQPNCFVTQD